MKKTFSIINPNKKPARQVDAIKHEIKKYIARERRKELPENVDYWDFSCKIGEAVESAEEVHITKINAMIDTIISNGKEEFYLEVKTKRGRRNSQRT